MDEQDLAGQLHDADQTELGIRIRNARLGLGMTQAQLAGDDVTVSYVSRIEAGQRRPDLALLRTFSERLKTPISDLILGGAIDDESAYTLLLNAAEFALMSGDGPEALRLTAELLAASSPAPPAHVEHEARYLRARALEISGNYDEAIDTLEQLCADDTGDRWLLGLIALSRCYRESGDFARAIEVGDRVRERLNELGLDGSDEAIQLEVTVGAAHFARGDVSHAIRMARRTIRRADQIGSPTARASAYWNASVYEASKGTPQAAIPLAKRALALLGEGEDDRNLARLRAQVGAMLLRLDPPEIEEAETHLYRASTDLQRAGGTVIDVARCDLAISRIKLASGDLDAAIAVASNVEQKAHGIAPLLEADALVIRGQATSLRGQTEDAAKLYRRAVSVLTSVGADRAAAQSWLELGALLDDAGETEAAKAAYRSAAVSTGLALPRALHAQI